MPSWLWRLPRAACTRSLLLRIQHSICKLKFSAELPSWLHRLSTGRRHEIKFSPNVVLTYQNHFGYCVLRSGSVRMVSSMMTVTLNYAILFQGQNDDRSNFGCMLSVTGSGWQDSSSCILRNNENYDCFWWRKRESRGLTKIATASSEEL